MPVGNKLYVGNTVGGIHISSSVSNHSIKFWFDTKLQQLHRVSGQII